MAWEVVLEPSFIPGGLDIFRVGKAYTIAEAAALAHTTSATVRRWLQGYDQPGHQMSPVFGGPKGRDDGQPLMVSFVELIEIIVVARFRKRAPSGAILSLDRLRRAHAYARKVFEVPYPFASLKLREFGGHVLHQFEAAEPGPCHLVLDLHGQFVLPGLVRAEVERNIDFNGQFAERWFPFGRSSKLVVDPRVAAGRVTVVGSGVTVEALRRRWKDGEPIHSIAGDYEIPADTIEEILQRVA